MLLAECVGVGRLSRASDIQPHVRRDAGLLAETRALPWDLDREKRILSVWRRLTHAPDDALTSHMLTGHNADGNWGSCSTDKFIADVHRTMARWGVQPALHGKRAWTQLSREAAATLTGDRMSDLPIDRERSDFMYKKSVPFKRDDAVAWSALLPQPSLRVSLRRLKLGIMPHVKATLLKCMPNATSRAWRQLSDGVQTDFKQCDCACGVQDATHMWFDCSHTDGLRSEVSEAACHVIDTMAPLVHRTWWHGLSPDRQLRHVVSSEVHMEVATERALRAACIPLLVSGMATVLPALGNDGFYADVRAFAA